MAVDAASLAGDRGIHRSEDRLVADGQELRDRYWIGLADERFNDRCHLRIQRRRRDCSPRSADPAQPEHVLRVARSIEQLDRMCPEGGRNRRPSGIQFLAQGGVVGDEGIDKLQRGTGLLGLVFNERPQARMIESIPRDGGKHGREEDHRDQPGSLSRPQEGHDYGTSLHRLLALGETRQGIEYNP